MNDKRLEDYIDVRERISAFHKAFPEGSLQTISWEVREIHDQTFVVYRAAAYRSPQDSRPGQGIAWEPFPGPTAFTRNSELMNAETAAWGRAIVALGLPASRQIASREEVRNRQAERDQREQPAQQNGGGLSDADLDRIKAAMLEAGVDNERMRLLLVGVGLSDVPDRVTRGVMRRLTEAQRDELMAELSVAVDSREAGDGD